MTAITSESISKTYKGGFLGRTQVPALRDFSLDVEEGQIFSLLGPNGAGKTTFIKILLSLTHPTEGSASILGEKLPNVQVRSRVGYLPESHRYPGYLTGEEVLKFFGRLAGVPSGLLSSRVPPLLEMMGIAQWKKMKVKKYSKGMMQRLGLAQAMINDPAVIFLDEPTDGVDPVGRKEIRDILTHLKNEGRTIFLNSHLLSEVELISDRVAILDKGQLLKVGTVDELTSTGLRYQIGYAGTLPPQFMEESAARVFAITYAEASLSVDLSTSSELNKLIDLLRKHGVEITSIGKTRSSLEESFIRLIKREVAP